jgi:DNA-binding IscR family transcriptional regulator
MPGGWTFLTNHGHVLLVVAGNPDARLREIAASVGITERATQLIVSDLETSGYLVKQRVGRRNRYLLNQARPFRHAAEAHRSVDELIAIFTPSAVGPRRLERGAVRRGAQSG